MDTGRRGLALAPERFPDPVRRRLGNLDRLREVWARRRRYGAGTEDPAVDRRSTRRRIAELRRLAGVDTPDSGGTAAEEDAFLAMADDCRSGVRLTPDYFESLVGTTPDFGPPLPAPSGVGERLADAAAVETHPVIRAAHLFATCTEALAPGPAAAAGDPPAHLRPLPWMLADLSLIRSDFPPPAIDVSCPLSPTGRGPDGRARSVPGDLPWHGPPPEGQVPSPRSGGDRLTALVLLFADLETAALRSELSRLAGARTGARGESGRLASAVHRRIVEHLRLRSAPLHLVLRELDPDCRAVVSSSTAGPGFTPQHPAARDAPVAAGPSDGSPARAGEAPEGAGGGAAPAAEPPDDAATATRTRAPAAPSTGERSLDSARRALFAPGANEWRASLDVDLADGVLRLLVLVQEVGSSSTGVLAVTADGLLTTDDGAEDVLAAGCAACVTLVPTDGPTIAGPRSRRSSTTCWRVPSAG